jgi:hypothetical protein
VDAFDALIPGAYKVLFYVSCALEYVSFELFAVMSHSFIVVSILQADLFRYLLLLKDGGVYADVYVMLETLLDNFITPSMSFFVPRDLVVDYANENFCFWNGLIGAAPGHPFLVRAVERLVNLILNRADLYDMEREICKSDGPRVVEVWKSRAMPEVPMSGPCALGVAVNEALGGKNSLAMYSPGWLPPIATESRFGRAIAADAGDALVLMVRLQNTANIARCCCRQ